jgi:hypothetical protein
MPNDWKRTAERLRKQLADAMQREGELRELIAMERAKTATLMSYLADRDEQIRRYEAYDAWTKTREPA